MSDPVYESTADAYAVCQCDATIRNGDLLVIPSEQVVGLAWTWPVAVTVFPGDLHTLDAAADVTRLRTNAGWTVAQVQAAVAEADRRGWPVDPRFRVA